MVYVLLSVAFAQYCFSAHFSCFSVGKAKCERKQVILLHGVTFPDEKWKVQITAEYFVSMRRWGIHEVAKNGTYNDTSIKLF